MEYWDIWNGIVELTLFLLLLTSSTREFDELGRISRSSCAFIVISCFHSRLNFVLIELDFSLTIPRHQKFAERRTKLCEFCYHWQEIYLKKSKLYCGVGRRNLWDKTKEEEEIRKKLQPWTGAGRWTESLSPACLTDEWRYWKRRTAKKMINWWWIKIESIIKKARKMCSASSEELIYVMCSLRMILPRNNNMKNVQIEFDNVEERANKFSLDMMNSRQW